MSTIQVHQPIKVTPHGNMYKMAIAHTDENGNSVRNYEVWATKEAVQQHFNDTTGSDPHKFQLQKFAKQMYQDRLRKTNGQIQTKENGLLATTNETIHGDTKLWPSTLAHPEIKY